MVPFFSSLILATPCCMAYGITVRWPGTEPGPQQILTTKPPGDFPSYGSCLSSEPSHQFCKLTNMIPFNQNWFLLFTTKNLDLFKTYSLPQQRLIQFKGLKCQCWETAKETSKWDSAIAETAQKENQKSNSPRYFIIYIFVFHDTQQYVWII